MDVLNVPLTRGFIATVDADRFESLLTYHFADGREFTTRPSELRWVVSKSKCLWYAMAFTEVNGSRAGMKLHRLLTECQSHLFADHKDGNTMHNVIGNLRVCTRPQNRRNSRGSSASGFKGVRLTRGGFASRIKIDGRGHWLGTFATAEEAARAYDVAAREHFGEFARTNF